MTSLSSSFGYRTLTKCFSAQRVVGALADVDHHLNATVAALLKKERLTEDALFKRYDIHRRAIFLDRAYPGFSFLLSKNKFYGKGIVDIIEATALILKEENKSLFSDVLPMWTDFSIECELPEETYYSRDNLVPWQQQSAYMTTGSDCHQITAFIPLTPLFKSAAEFQLLRGQWSEKRITIPHEGCWKNTPQLFIPESELPFDDS
eukprot:PhM_4_TR3386/c0_g1_i2/m.79125